MVKQWISLLLLLSLLAALLLPVSAAQHGWLDETEDEDAPPEPIPTVQTGFDPIWPADTSYEVSCLYYYQTGREHSCRYTYRNGIDIAGEGNALAVEDGVIEVVDYLYNSYGNYIVLLHDNGGRSIYAHLARTYVQEGQRVEQGEIIAKIGTSGKSAGVHLHYEYSLADPWLTFYKDKYYNKLYYEQNCLYNNEKYNDSKLICQWITDNFVQDEEYFYWNGKTPVMEQVDTAYPTPFWATLLTKQPVTAYQWIGGNEECSIAPGTECLIEAVYESGWCRVLLRWEEAKMGYLTVYVPTDSFFDPEAAPMDHRALADMSGWQDGDMATASAALSAGTAFTEVDQANGLLQVVAEVEPGVSRLLWIEHSGDALSGVSIGSNFTATLSDQAQENLLVLTEGSPVMADPLSVRSTAWSFDYQGDGRYTVSDPQSGAVLSAQSDGSVSMESASGSEATLWMLCGTGTEAVVLRAADQQVLSSREDGSLYLADYSGAEGQRFYLDSEMIYDLHYDGNGGSAYRDIETNLPYQSTVTVSNVVPEPVSYTLHFDVGEGEIQSKTYTPVFTGWNSRQDGSGSSYQAGDTLPILGPTKLYAQWEPLVLGALPTPSLEGYSFDGWYSESGIPMTDTSVLSHSATLYARWTPVKSVNVGLILLCIFAGLVLLVLLVIVFYYVQKKKNAQRQARLAARRHHSTPTK